MCDILHNASIEQPRFFVKIRPRPRLRILCFTKKSSLKFGEKHRAPKRFFASALYNKVENISETALYYNLDRRALSDRWQKPGDKARFKAISIDDTTPMSSRFVLRENYIAGESISIGYETSARWLHVVGVKGASFRFYMNDIFRLASFKEERGTDYPFSKSFSLSISLRF